MSDSISATDVEIVDINQDINKKNMQIVIDDNDTDNDDDGNVAIQPIDMLVKENSKRIKYCEEICSKYCWSKDGNKDNYCDPNCNSKECDYDGGKCDF